MPILEKAEHAFLAHEIRDGFRLRHQQLDLHVVLFPDGLVETVRFRMQTARVQSEHTRPETQAMCHIDENHVLGA